MRCLSVIFKIYFSLVLIYIAFPSSVMAQGNVGIGTTTPNSSAILDIESTDKGLLIPRMTTAQRLALTPNNGLVVYDSDCGCFWYYYKKGAESGWVTLSGAYSNISRKTADYTTTDCDNTILADGKTNTVTITLPAAATVKGRIYTIKAVDITNTVTIKGNAAETIDGANTFVFATANQSAMLQSDGTAWFILNK